MIIILLRFFGPKSWGRCLLTSVLRSLHYTLPLPAIKEGRTSIPGAFARMRELRPNNDGTCEHTPTSTEDT